MSRPKIGHGQLSRKPHERARARSERRCSEDALRLLGCNLFKAAGLDAEKAECVARLLVLTDMMGRSTTALPSATPISSRSSTAAWTRSGGPQTVRDSGSIIVWDGEYLPGLWLMDRALSLGFERLPQHGVVTFAIRRSHHIGCLAAIAKQATDRGYFVMIASSGPHTKAVAPFGGTQDCLVRIPLRSAFRRRRRPFWSISARRSRRSR